MADCHTGKGTHTMYVTEAYSPMQETLNARQTPSQMAYTPSLGFHLTLSLPDGYAYTLTAPEETDHGQGWDLRRTDGTPARVRATADEVVGFVTITQMAAAIWAATPTPPAGLVLSPRVAARQAELDRLNREAQARAFAALH